MAFVDPERRLYSIFAIIFLFAIFERAALVTCNAYIRSSLQLARRHSLLHRRHRRLRLGGWHPHAIAMERCILLVLEILLTFSSQPLPSPSPSSHSQTAICVALRYFLRYVISPLTFVVDTRLHLAPSF